MANQKETEPHIRVVLHGPPEALRALGRLEIGWEGLEVQPPAGVIEQFQAAARLREPEQDPPSFASTVVRWLENAPEGFPRTVRFTLGKDGRRRECTLAEGPSSLEASASTLGDAFYRAVTRWETIR